MSPNPESILDLKQIISDKNPALAKKIPWFVMNYLKRVIHINDLNDFLAINHNKQGLDFAAGALDFLNISYSCTGLDNLQENGKYIFVSNHPLGGLDGLSLMDCVGKKFKDIKFIVNDILYNVENLRDVFLPVNKHGRQTQEYLKMIHSAYNSDAQILSFPAGLCSRRIKGKITDLPWRPGFIKDAVEWKRDVVPVFFSGKNSGFFYRLAQIRSFLGIKSNIEMLYLVDEMVMQKGKHFSIHFGEPVSYSVFNNSRKPKDWAWEVRKIVENMKP